MILLVLRTLSQFRTFESKSLPNSLLFLLLFLALRRRSTSSACTGATAARRRRPKRRAGTTAAPAAPTLSVTTGWTGPSSRACTGCWRLGPAAPSSTPTLWPTAPSPCWTRTATVWWPSASWPAGWVGGLVGRHGSSFRKFSVINCG